MKKIVYAAGVAVLLQASAHAANIAASTSSPITTTVTVGAGDSWEQNAGYEHFTVNAGGFLDATDSTGRFRIGVATTGSLTIDGGAVNIGTTDTILLGNGSATRSALIDVVSGSLNVEAGFNQFFLGRQGSTGIIRIEDGTVTLPELPQLDVINSGKEGIGYFDFTTALDGTGTGSLTVTGLVEQDYIDMFDGDDLYYNGSNAGNFSDYFEVTGSTLSVIPEPATLGLVAAFGAGILFIRRRFMI
ncbi:PEP-CTERM sorting domain-containing protein [Pontiellaceae bacterium B12227]|nr:PEP-CTERM sorting domain-containing protein [Pontiellaceae bacterium B12227]